MQQRTVFVDIVGWVFVVLAGFGVLTGVLQNVLLHAVFPPDWHELVTAGAEQARHGFEIFRYLEWLLAALLIVMIMMLITAVALLQRREWARRVFIGLMVFGILWNFVNLAWQVFLFDEFMPRSTGATNGIDMYFENLRIAMSWGMTIFAVMLSAVFGWISWQLTRPHIRGEFLSGA